MTRRPIYKKHTTTYEISKMILCPTRKVGQSSFFILAIGLQTSSFYSIINLELHRSVIPSDRLEVQMAIEIPERLITPNVPKKERGRQARPAITPLGKFLQKQLKEKGITLSEFAQRLHVSRSTVNRLLYSDPAFIDSVFEESICLVLALQERERQNIHELVDEIHRSTAPSIKAADISSTNQLDTGSTRGRGRPAKLPANPLAAFLQKHLQANGIKRQELARRLHVSPSTISRLLNGDTETVHSMNEGSICQALNMDDGERRKFQELIHGGLLHEKKLFALVTTKGIDLDWADYYAEELQRQFDQGNAKYVLEEAKRYYNMRYPAKDVRSPEILMRFGKLLATAQDVLLPWNDRILPTIHTYDRIENMLFSFPLKKIPSYQTHYAYILAHRAPLYREIGQLGESSREFTIALEECIREVDDIDLHVELYYSRAHVWVVQGNIHNWLRDLEAARAVAQTAHGDQRKQLLGLITYTQGEGYKRLAYNNRLNLSSRQRTHYAAQGLACFEQTGFVAQRRWAAHALIHGVAEAQCLVSLDPNEAIRRCEQMRIRAEQVYPSIVQKINTTIAAAQRLLRGQAVLPGL
jgi:transcriptional regulator with XRE-family HTH domain